VLNTMIDDGDAELAAIIFHELAHQLLYVPGDSEFNEAFAVTVEEVGLARWLASRGASADLQSYHARRARQAQFVALFIRRRAELQTLYAQPLAPWLMRERKRAVFASLGSDIEGLEARLHVRTGYERWIAEGLNNAHLASLATYFQCVPGFERLLAREDGNLPRFYAAVRALARRPTAARRAALCVQTGAAADRGA
jgi:predicted aminopeptidase